MNDIGYGKEKHRTLTSFNWVFDHLFIKFVSFFCITNLQPKKIGNKKNGRKKKLLSFYALAQAL